MVSNSQKQFFLKLHCPKNDQILDKVLRYLHRPEFCLIFHLLFGQWSFKKKCSSDLMTFNGRNWLVNSEIRPLCFGNEILTRKSVIDHELQTSFFPLELSLGTILSLRKHLFPNHSGTKLDDEWAEWQIC